MIYTGDSLEILKTLDSKSVDMCITSPPYFNLRDYGVEGQIGIENSVDEYIEKLINVFNEVKRVLKDDGSCWVNIDDTYKDKGLLCVPDIFKIEMVRNGWICRNEIIWHKPNAMPSSAKSRYNNDYEKLFFFTKSKNYYFKTQYEPFKSMVTNKNNSVSIGKYKNIEQESSVRQGMNRARGRKIVEVRKSLPEQHLFVEFLRNATSIDFLVRNTNIPKTKIEHWFRRDTCGFAYPSVEDWEVIRDYVNDWSETFQEIDFALTDITYETDSIMKNADKGRVKRSVWDINTKAFKGLHYAPFPMELVESPIDATCREGGTVLDCFMGSGTVGIVAKKQNKQFIGIDLNPEYCDIARKRIETFEINGSEELEIEGQLTIFDFVKYQSPIKKE